MTDRQKNSEFLKRLMLYEDSETSRQLEERINQAEKEERLIKWALGRVALLAALSPVGVYCSMSLVPDFLQHQSPLILKSFLVLGLASFISLVTFAGLWLRCRSILDGHYGQCRDLINVALERSLKQVYTIPFPRRVQLRDEHTHQNRTVVESEGNTTAQWQRAV